MEWLNDRMEIGKGLSHYQQLATKIPLNWDKLLDRRLKRCLNEEIVKLI